MTVKDFETYVQKGLGRAITLLKEQEDKTPFCTPLINLITLKERSPRPFFGQYEIDLINCFPNSDEIAATIARTTFMQITKGSFNLPAVHLSVMLGYADMMVHASEQQYAKSYKELVEFTKLASPKEKYPACAKSYVDALAALTYCKVDLERVWKILWDLADMFEYSDNPIVPAHQNPLWRIWDFYGKDTIDQMLDKIEATHPHSDKFKKHFPRSQLFTPKPITPIENITAKEISDSRDFGSTDYAQLVVSFSKADESVIKEVAEKVLLETDLNKQRYLLSFFRPFLPNVVAPKFPLDPTPLVRSFEKIEQELYLDPNSPAAANAIEYLDALYMINHPSIKALGKKILKKAFNLFKSESLWNIQSTKNHVRSGIIYHYALMMYFGINYDPRDKDEFVKILLAEAPFVSEVQAFNVYVYLIGSKAPGTPTELVPKIYDLIDSPTLRLSFVEALIEADILPQNIKDECQYDCNLKTRELVRDN